MMCELAEGVEMPHKTWQTLPCIAQQLALHEYDKLQNLACQELAIDGLLRDHRSAACLCTSRLLKGCTTLEASSSQGQRVPLS